MGNTHIHSPDQVRRPRRNKMAPVEIDHIPRSFSIENLNLKSVEKALELPLVNSAYTEVTRMASPITPYVESTLSKAGTEKAKKIEEASIAEAVLFMLGVTDLLALLGFKLTKKEQVEEKAEKSEK